MIKITNIKSKFTPLKRMASGRWKLSFGFVPFVITSEDKTSDSSDIGTWTETFLSGKPSIEQVKGIILDTLNKEIDQKILSGMVWNGMEVWLSSENQFNYKAAYDLAVQTNGITLPVKFKFGNPENPIYYVFKDLPDFTDFYASAMKYINDTLAAGWLAKDNINWDNYK